MNEPEFFDVTYSSPVSRVHLGQHDHSGRTLCGRRLGHPQPPDFHYSSQMYKRRADDPTYYCFLCAWKAAYQIGVN